MGNVISKLKYPISDENEELNIKDNDNFDNYDKSKISVWDTINITDISYLFEMNDDNK